MPFQRRPPFRDQYQENRPTNYSRFPKHSLQNSYSDNQKNFGSPSYYDQPFPRRDQVFFFFFWKITFPLLIYEGIIANK